MSGLTVFFRHQLVAAAAAVDGENGNDDTFMLGNAVRNDDKDRNGDDDDDEEDPYQRSLLLHSVASNAVAAVPQPLSSASTTATSATSATSATATRAYKMWKLQRNLLLQTYMEARILIVPQEEEEEYDEEEEDNNDHDGEQEEEEDRHENENSCSAEQEETQPDEFESQQQQQQQQSAGIEHYGQNTPQTTTSSTTTTTTTTARNNNKNTLHDRNQIPHIDCTVGTCCELGQLTLASRMLQLKVCRATKICPRRTLKRDAVKYAGQWQPMSLLSATTADSGHEQGVTGHALQHQQQGQDDDYEEPPPLLPRLVLRPGIQDDGPLATCYSQTVVSMEITQVSVDMDDGSNTADGQQRDELRRRAQRALLHDMDDDMDDCAAVAAAATRIRPLPDATMPVFFYNRYAAAMEQILQEKPANAPLLLSFHKVPAKCVLPYPVQDTWMTTTTTTTKTITDWFRRQQHLDSSQQQQQQQQEPCCLCIGDASSMRADLGGETSVYIRFDDCDMRITAGWAVEEDVRGTKKNKTGSDSPATNAASQTTTTCREFLLQPCNKGGVVVTEMKDSDNGPLTQYMQVQLYQQASSTASLEPVVMATAAGAAKPTTATTMIPMPVVGAVTAAANHGLSTSTTAHAPTRDQPAAAPTVVPVVTAPPKPACTTQAGETDRSTDRSQLENQPHLEPRILPTRERTESPHRKKAKPTDAVVSYVLLRELQSYFESHQSQSTQPDSVEGGVCLVNLYAVVVGFGSPSKTKRGDWMVGIALVDETLPLESEQNKMLDSVHTININIFAKTLQDLPDIRYAGDVLRVHRVRLQKWNDEMQLMGMRKSSYVVCRDESSVPGGTNEWSIRPTARDEFTMTQADESRFADLWQWGQGRLLSHPTMKLSLSFKLCDMQRQDHGQIETYSDEHTRGDLTVMVASIIPVPEDLTSGVSPRGFLRVWDGTGFPASDPLPLATAAASDAVKNGDPPSEAIVAIAAIIKNLRRVRPDSNLLPPKAVSGRVANVAIWEDSHWQLVAKAVRVGSFIRLRNVQDSRMQGNGLRCLMVFCKSYLTPLPGLTYEVVELLQNHNERILGNEPLNPQSGILPLEMESGETKVATTAVASTEQETNRPAPPRAATGAATLHQLAELLSGPVPTLFAGPVRIVGTIPSVSSLSSSGMNDMCHQEGETGAMVYRFAVRLQQDSGATVDAIVNSAVGESLVGMHASNAIADPTGALYNVLAVFQGKWQVHVRSVAFAGAKYFLLESATGI